VDNLRIFLFLFFVDNPKHNSYYQEFKTIYSNPSNFLSIPYKSILKVEETKTDKSLLRNKGGANSIILYTESQKARKGNRLNQASRTLKTKKAFYILFGVLLLAPLSLTHIPQMEKKAF
jgi:hypothetical protein